MREYLINNSRGLCIAKTRSPMSCAYSGAQIDARQHAIAVRREYDDNSFVVWVSIGSVDGLIDALQSFDPSANQLGTDVSPSGRIRYNETNGETLYCAACEQHMPNGTEGFSFYNPSANGSYAWLHTGHCVDRFCNALDDVWEFSPELLPEGL